jgi:predicted TIM-barrel fold metal-dependent hydrolase
MTEATSTAAATPIVDVHAHYFPPVMSELWERYGGRPVWPPHPDGMSERVAALEEAGVDLQVIGVGHNQPTMPKAADSVDAARFVNDLYAETIREQGRGRLAGFGALPMADPDAALPEIGRCLDELGFVGIGLGASVHDDELDDPKFTEVWEELDRRAAAVYIHPVSGPRTVTPGMAKYMMPTTLGGPIETAVLGIRLLLSGVRTRFPNVRIILAAGGGALPYLYPRFVETTRSVDRDADLEGYDGVAEDALQAFFYDTTLSDHPAQLPYMDAAVGLERVMFGTDAPRVTVERWLGIVRGNLEAADLPREGVLGANAASVLGLDLAAAG